VATITQRGSKYRVRIRKNGEYQSKTFKTKLEAEIWAKTIEQPEAVADMVIAVSGYNPVTYREVLTKYLELETPQKRTADNERLMIEKILTASWVDIPIAKLQAADFTAYRNERLRDIKASSFNRYMDIVRAAAHVMQEQYDWSIGKVDLLTTGRAKKSPEQAIRRIPKEKLEALFAATLHKGVQSYLHWMLKVALETGMRRQELIDLEWREVDFERNTINLVRTKTDYPRTIPMTPVCHEALKTWLEAQKGDVDTRVFPVTSNAVRLSYQRTQKRANAKDIRFHDFRHEAISRFFEMGLTVPEVRSISGHRTMSALLRYTHHSASTLAQKLGGKANV
jgi:integrase